MNELISPEYVALNAELHERSPLYGSYGHRWAETVDLLARENKCDHILDYGCGKESLGDALRHRKVVGYDPAVPGRGIAAPCDLVVCADVLEHVEPEKLDAVIEHLREVTIRKLFVVVATRASSQTLSDGRNAHLIVKDGAWWRGQLEQHFSFDEWDDQGDESIGIGSPLLLVKPEDIQSRAAVTDDERNRQVKANVRRISARVTQKGDAPKLPAHDRTAVLVCYGPSLKQTWPLVKMAKYRTDADVFTVSAAHRFLLDRGVVPYAHIDCDPREHKAVQIGDPHKDVKYWLASCIHPTYLDKLEGYDVALWHSFNGAESMVAMQWDVGHRMVMGGGSIGLRAISLLYYLGYRTFEIHGLDCSYQDGQVYAGEHLGKEKPSVRVKCGDRWFETSAIFIIYARYFAKEVTWLSDCSFYLHGDGLLQHICAMGGVIPAKAA